MSDLVLAALPLVVPSSRAEDLRLANKELDQQDQDALEATLEIFAEGILRNRRRNRLRNDSPNTEEIPAS